MHVNELMLAELCIRAYDGTDHYEDFDLHVPITNARAEAVALYSNDTMFVVGRGTELVEPADVSTVMRSLFTARHRYGRVHRGFKDYADTMLTPLVILTTMRPPKRIVLAGHSLGGGIATLLAADFIERRTADEIILFTVGCPRVGRKQFATTMAGKMGESCYQFVIDTDLVTHLPPRIWPWRYRHITRGYQLGEPDEHANSHSALMFAVLKQALGMQTRIEKPIENLRRKLGIAALADHGSRVYRDEISHWVEERKQENRSTLIDFYT